jgi:phosphomannomutase/phosphoglucomutase
MINKNIFRGYDIRGIYPTEVNEEVAGLIGKGFATQMLKEGQTKIIVGHDNRLSSEGLLEGLIKGIISTGMNVIDIGLVITPMSYFAREWLKVRPSIMITASHNPKEYNGFKICATGKDTIYGEQIQELRRFIDEEELMTGEKSGSVEHRDIREDYINFITNKIKLGNRKLKVAIDCGNGTGSIVAEKIFNKLGAEVLPLYCESDGNFPNHHPDPTIESNMTDLQKFIVENKCDVGLGFDGDSDRVICFDENGHIIYGDEFMIIAWRDLMPKHPGSKGILDVKCTQSLYEEIEKLGGTPEFVRVGSSFIKAELREHNLIFAGEYAGHIYYNDEYFGFDDGMYAGARMLQILSNTNKKMSELLDGINKYVGTPEKIIKATDETKTKIVADVTKHFKDAGYKVIDIDGARVIFEHGWGLVRYSNTGPNITVKAEADTKENVETIMQELEAAIGKSMKSID